MSLKPVQENLSFLQGRFFYVIIAVSIFFALAWGRLYYLQILRGDDYRDFARETTLKEIRLPAVRGSILDRNKVPLVSNRPAFDLAIVPQYVRDLPRLKLSLEQLVGMEPDILQAKWDKAHSMPSFYPLTIRQDMGYDAMAKVRVHQAIISNTGDYDLQGVEVQSQSVRRYPRNSMAAATLGYVRESSREELDRLQAAVPDIYYLGDRVGATGLERRWEVLLRGRDGYQEKIINAVGREVTAEEWVSPLAGQKPRPGNNLVLTLDYRLQAYAETLFGDESGALVALDPRNGEILAIASEPSFDLAELASRMSPEQWHRLLHDPRKVFLHRALQAAYPPGSTFKIVTAAAILEGKVMSPDEKVYCPGYLKVGDRVFRCWKHNGHGWMNLHQALVQSCDVYFYTAGLRLGVDRLAHYAREFGLGTPTGIDLAGEASGLIPTREWKKQNRGRDWQPGETLSVAIGQGYDLVTPLQNAVMMSVVANGGYRVRPHIARNFIDHAGHQFPVPGHELQRNTVSVGLAKSTLAALQSSLAGVVSEEGGTAHRLRKLEIPIAGKTGTAQVVGAEAGSGKGQHRDHAWFVAYAPVSSPEIVVSVIVEHGGHGGAAAAPIAGALIEKYMELKSQGAGQQQASDGLRKEVH